MVIVCDECDQVYYCASSCQSYITTVHVTWPFTNSLQIPYNSSVYTCSISSVNTKLFTLFHCGWCVIYLCFNTKLPDSNKTKCLIQLLTWTEYRKHGRSIICNSTILHWIYVLTIIGQKKFVSCPLASPQFHVFFLIFPVLHPVACLDSMCTLALHYPNQFILIYRTKLKWSKA